jgi:fructose-bisphosphate aldolase, class II
MALVTMNEVLKESIARKYAVGAFDTLDYCFTEAILSAAEARGTPIILMVVGLVFKMPYFERFFKYLVDRCQCSTVPVALQLDHGSSFDEVMIAIRYGCTAVMLDGSSLPFDQNIAATRKVCEVAHACGISVEGEIGHVSGHEGNMLDGNIADADAYTKVEEAVLFARETNVDALAIAVGTVHGVYKGVPKLDYERLRDIRKAVMIPLVMHGGSGLSPEAFRLAIQNGINKINFFTGMSLAASEAAKKIIQDRQGKLHFSEIVQAGMNRAAEIVSEHIGIFGTQPLSL